MEKEMTPHLRAALPWILGYAGLLVFEDSSKVFRAAEQGFAIDGYLVTAISFSFCLLVIVVFAGRMDRLFRSRGFLLTVALVPIAIAPLFLLGAFDGGVLAVAGPYLTVLTFSVFQSVYQLRFLELLSRYRMSVVLLYLALGNIISLPLTILCNTVFPPVLDMVFRLAIPPAVFFCLGMLDAKGADDDGENQDEDAPAGKPLTLLRPMILLALVCAAMSFVRSFVPDDSDLFPLLGFLVAWVSIALIMMRKKTIIRFRYLYRVSEILILLSLLLIPLPLAHASTVAGVVGSAGYSLFELLMMAILANACRLKTINPKVAFGIFLIVINLTFALGGVFGARIVQTDSFRVAMVAFGLAVALSSAFTVLLTDQDYRTSWGTVKPKSPRPSVTEFYYGLPDVCAGLSQQFGLTRREEEILLLLAQRKRIPDIEAELFISNSTAKTHVRNIYRKLGIHKRTELFALMGHLGMQNDGVEGADTQDE